MQCATSPFIDNEFKFANCSTIHDGYEFTRNEKLDNIIRYCKDTSSKFNMHVCWHSHSGKNCNLCEKCARTYLYFIAISENPNDYGFNVNEETLSQLEENFNKSFIENENVDGWSIHRTTLNFWREHQELFKENEEHWRETSLKWLLDVDFDEIEKRVK